MFCDMLGRCQDEDRGKEGKGPGARAPEKFFMDTSSRTPENVA